jgi:hypothetical protein
MIVLILILLVAAQVISVTFYKKNNDVDLGIGSILSSTGLVIFLIIFVFLLIEVSSGRTIDSKIELYQTQNTEIESKIQVTVASYLAHERQTYKDLKPDNAVAVVSAYPELHSNELVKKQIEVYEENNKMIMNLRERKLNQSVYKWWLYFGR